MSPAAVAAIIAVCCLWPSDSAHSTTRSSAARAAFQRDQPCPANGSRRGACPGYVVDHIEPLCAGGADAPRNMQWQTINDAKRKDRVEHDLCRSLRRIS
jgi:hypothetical protein